jgi:hypothetical protein
MKESLDPLKWVSSLTGKGTFGKVATTIAGRAFGRSEDTIEYFGGYGRKRKPKIKRDASHSTIGPGSATSLKVGDSESNILAKMYNFMEKTHEVQKKTYEIELAFREEEKSEEERRHKKLIDALYGRKSDTKTTADKPDDEKTFLEKIYEGIKKALSSIIAPILLTLAGLKKDIDSLMKIAGTLAKNLLDPVYKLLKPMVSGLVGVLVRSLLNPYVLAALIGYAVAEYMKFNKFTESTDATLMRSSSDVLPGKLQNQKGEIVSDSKGSPIKLSGENLLKYNPEAVEKISNGELKTYDLYLPGTNQRQQLPLNDQESGVLKEKYYKLASIPNLMKEYNGKTDSVSIEKLRQLQNLQKELEADILKIWQGVMKKRFSKPPEAITEYISNKLKYPDKGRFEGKYEALKDEFFNNKPIPTILPEDAPSEIDNNMGVVQVYGQTNNIGGSKPQTFNSSSVKVRNDDLRRHNYRLSVSV